VRPSPIPAFSLPRGVLPPRMCVHPILDLPDLLFAPQADVAALGDGPPDHAVMVPIGATPARTTRMGEVQPGTLAVLSGIFLDISRRANRSVIVRRHSAEPAGFP